MNIRDICLRAAEVKKKCDRTRRWGAVMVFVVWCAIWLVLGALIYSLLWGPESAGGEPVPHSAFRISHFALDAQQTSSGDPRRGGSRALKTSPEAGRDQPLGQSAGALLWRVTAYCPCPICCGPRACGITASGARADHPLVAGPPWLAFGTPLNIPGYAGGSAVCVEDRGGAITEGRLDVLMPTHAQARAWGVRHLAVACGHSGT